MTPPVRFFERLMPGASSAGARVHAALPSRFAPPALELGPQESVAYDDGADIGAPTRDQNVAARGHAPLTEPSAATPAPARAESVVSDGSPVVEARKPRVSAPPDLPVAADTPTRGPSAEPLPTRQRANAADIVPLARGKGAARDAPALVGARRAALVPAASVPHHAPLRERVREQRLGPPPVPPSTIVQVTIDRIDVRAPAANAQPDRTVSKPRNASWKSLGDYLRERERGGAS